jgi:hypothetical protein
VDGAIGGIRWWDWLRRAARNDLRDRVSVAAAAAAIDDELRHQT